MKTPEQLHSEEVIRVAKTYGVTVAAEHFGISKQAVSQKIKRAEKQPDGSPRKRGRPRAV